MNTDLAKDSPLTNKQKSIVAISAFTAKGELNKLKTKLIIALDAGLTVNEIKEIFIQLYAYCGFPRSLNAINTFEAVVTERKSKGIVDLAGPEAATLPDTTNKYETGKQNLERLTGKPENGPKTGYAAFVPVIEIFLKEHLFADIFSRGILTDKERELITVSALTSMGGLSAQLQGHLSICLHLGISEGQLRQMLDLIRTEIGDKEAAAGEAVLTKVLSVNNSK